MKPHWTWMLLLVFLVAFGAGIDGALKIPRAEIRRAEQKAKEARKALANDDLVVARDLIGQLRTELDQGAPLALAFEELRLGLSGNDPTLVNAALQRIESAGLDAGLWPFAAAWFASAKSADELQRAGDLASTEEDLKGALAAARQAFDAASAAVIESKEDWPQARRNAERILRRLAALEARIAATGPEEQAPKLPPPQKENQKPEESGAETAEEPMPLPGRTRLLSAAEIAGLQKRLEAKEGQKRALREKAQRGGAQGEDW